MCVLVCLSSGVGGGSSESSEGDSPPVPGSSEDEGSNLMDSSPSLVVLDPTLLDLPRELLEQELFESYTYTGKHPSACNPLNYWTVQTVYMHSSFPVSIQLIEI